MEKNNENWHVEKKITRTQSQKAEKRTKKNYKVKLDWIK